ncbi:tetratricopeptide repeat protein [Roseomonas sp. CAU 1739]|uniref:tetratricopeptide repeat protein n=1 Tax=Roseomonas sp. CAU 1739 TaxID=3140364 RepID=UPI00325A83BF
MAPPGPTILFEDPELRVVHRPGGSDFTLVTFSDLTYSGSGTDFWGREVVETLDLDAVGFVAKRQNWFPEASVEAAADAVRAVLKPRSLAYGFSMGAHGALRHGGRIGVQSCLAVAPQITIAPAETPWDPRYHGFHRPALHAGMRVGAQHLAPFVAILADPYDAPDWQHASLVAAAGKVELIRTPLLSHAAIWLLVGSEPFGAVLGPALAGDAAALRAELRRRRGLSGHWFRLMGRAAFRRGHERLAEALWSRGQAIGMPGATIGAERADALGDRIETLIARGRRGEAIEACAALERLAPRAPGLVGRAAHLLLAAGSPADAEPVFRRAIALQPNGADLHRGLSLALCDLGRPAEALAVARAGHAVQPGDVDLATHLGHLLNAGGPTNGAEAERAFRAALARHPSSGRALFGLSSVVAARGERQQALALAQRAAARLPGDIAVLAWLARVLLDNGNTERAEQLFRRVLRTVPHGVDGFLGLADTLHATGRRDEAVALLERGLARLPGEPSLAERRLTFIAQRPAPPPPPPPKRRKPWLRRMFGWLRLGRSSSVAVPVTGRLRAAVTLLRRRLRLQ